MNKGLLLIIFLLIVSYGSMAQPSVARQWNETLLKAIRNDFARPTVHARNLFHLSAGTYDIWAAYSSTGSTYFLGRRHGTYYFPYETVGLPKDDVLAIEEAISYFSYRLIRFRFRNSPKWADTFLHIENLMDALGYDRNFTSEDYSNGAPAALGNYIAARVIEFGLQDGSNEGGSYQNLEYEPVNSPLTLREPGSQGISDPNRWQPLAFDTFVDQSGNEMTAGTPPFLSPEWGRVLPFSLKEENLTIQQKNGVDWWIYHDPGDPCYIHGEDANQADDYKWNFGLVVNWTAHHDPSDGVQWDISPGAMGNVDIHQFPKNFASHRDIYQQIDGGGLGSGHMVNPTTLQPYKSQIVPRGDYTRVLAEFWADGPDSETPPGHWYTILNYVTDHPLFERKFQGEGRELSPLEWDVKSYFVLGGAMHDAAITAWSIKGYYDYVRPISAIRYMADKGQSSDENLPNFHPDGMILIDELVELVEESDPLAGPNGENVGKIKVLSWKGHDFIETTADMAGVGWILGENWWPYQRPTFVTPPFSGYVSGHSTFSRAAAKVLSQLTGDDYFPGGMAEFLAKKNEFLVFEEGPSEDISLQWATYYDASDQCSLSRIWGGIHPPVDDMPGRLIGEKVGENAFWFAVKYFENVVVGLDEVSLPDGASVFPNPVISGNPVHIKLPFDLQHLTIKLVNLNGAIVFEEKDITNKGLEVVIETSFLKPGAYVVIIESNSAAVNKLLLVK